MTAIPSITIQSLPTSTNAMPSTTTPSAPHDRSDAIPELDASTCQRFLAEPGTVLVDCREADEHARERIAGSRLLPLSRLDAGQVAAQIEALGANRVVFHCRGGRRSLDAATRCSALRARGIEIVSLQGGIEAWKQAGLPTVVDAARPKMGVMQQTQAFAGFAILATTALGAFVHPAFLIGAALVGVGMVHAGLTGNCSLSNVLATMPWNKVRGNKVRGNKMPGNQMPGNQTTGGTRASGSCGGIARPDSNRAHSEPRRAA